MAFAGSNPASGANFKNSDKMQEYYNVKRLALIFATQAEIEGMKSENEDRKQMGHSMAYTDSDFREKAMELRNLASMLNEFL